MLFRRDSFPYDIVLSKEGGGMTMSWEGCSCLVPRASGVKQNPVAQPSAAVAWQTLEQAGVPGWAHFRESWRSKLGSAAGFRVSRALWCGLSLAGVGP